MTRVEALDHGRECLRRQQWSTAYEHLIALEHEAPLDADDLAGVAMACHLLGLEAETAHLLAQAHQRFLAEGNPPRAARCAFWLAFQMLNTGEVAQASGWLARAQRLLAEPPCECVEQGYLLIPAGIRSVREGNPETAIDYFDRAATIGERFADTDLLTLAHHGLGRSLITNGDIAQGVSLLDESMVAIVAGEASPLIAGALYCSIIEACTGIFDLRRAQEWTAALERWCASQPEMVPYRSHCQTRRAEILQLHGDWPEALEEAEHARDRLSQPPPKRALGAALYRIAELHRMRGDSTRAEELYGESCQCDPRPRPGLALLRLAQGQIAAAKAGILHVADAEHDPSARPAVLEAYVEIMLAAGDVAAARRASEELSALAGRLRAPLLDAIACHAKGAVLLAEKKSREAASSLREALTIWRELEAPYESARVQVLLALACREQGNTDTADLELRAARRSFELLGAAPELARAEALLGTEAVKATGPLTGREEQVLRLIASGVTNRTIAKRLGISEKTVARHVSNIFAKLDLGSRAAATAYAYQHGLGTPST
jgi:DNA-binding CsgD family transcriptional regulator